MKRVRAGAALRVRREGRRYTLSGLIDGYRATSHWISVDRLAALGAIPVRERVVIDRDRITGGGVTAGIDFSACGSSP